MIPARPLHALAALLLLSSCVVVAPAQDDAPASPPAEEAAEKRARFSLVLGGRALDDEDYWEPLEDHGAFGLEVAGPIGDAPVDWEVGFQVSAADEEENDRDLAASVAELYAGVTWSPVRDGRVVPYLGLGLSALTARVESTDDVGGGHVSTWDDDGGLGWYAHAGFRWMATEIFGVGLDYRILRGTDLDLFQDDVDVDYDQLALVFSAGF